MWQQAEGRRLAFAGFIALLLSAQLIRLSIPFFFGEAVNALQAGSIRRAAGLMGWMVGAAVAAWILHGPGRILERFTALAMRERYADALYAHAMRLPLSWHERNHSGDTIHRMSKSTGALFGFTQTQFIYLQNAVNLVGPLVALTVISRVTGLSALLGYAAIVTLLTQIDGPMVKLAREENQAERRYTAALVDCLGNVATVMTLRFQEATRRLVGERLRAVSAPLKRSIVINEVKWATVDLLNNAMRSGIVVLYAWLDWRATGGIAVGTAVMVYQYSQQLGGVVSEIAARWGELVRHQTDIAAADAILEASPAPSHAPRASDDAWREIRVEDLSFSHGRTDRATLDGVSLVLRRGARIALVGTTGSGKSSLLRVLAGLHPGASARFFVDGAPRDDVRHLGHLAILVPQDPEVFETTIEHNVTLGLEHPAAAVRTACDTACLGPVIDGLSEGLSTRVAERGANLSGGQRQRIALARGLLAARDASIVMLDESTSSVDPATEASIYERIWEELRHACIVATVHRLHLLPRFDTVVLLDEGRVVDVGTFADLLVRQPRLRAMCRDVERTSSTTIAA